MKHIMVDLETFATGRDAAIVSIGAVTFDPQMGPGGTVGTTPQELFCVNVDLAHSRSPGVLDASTVEWWLRQSQEAREAMTSGTRLPLEKALQAFTSWIRDVYPGNTTRYDTKFRLWSNGPTFDEMILRDAYLRCGMSFPIHYRASRCCRTILDIGLRAGIKKEMAAAKKTRGTKHSALDDAAFQANGVCAIYEHLNLGGV